MTDYGIFSNMWFICLDVDCIWQEKRPTAWDEFFSLRNEAKVW